MWSSFQYLGNRSITRPPERQMQSSGGELGEEIDTISLGRLKKKKKKNSAPTMFCPWAKFLELLSDGSWQVRVGLGRKCQLTPLHFDPQSDSSMKTVPNGNGQIPRKSEGHSQNKGRGYWTGKKQQMFTTCIFVLSREKSFLSKLVHLIQRC